MSEEFYKRYQNIPSPIKRYTDPIVRLGIKASPNISNIKKKGDTWIAHKKSSFGKPFKKRRL